jgi:hypothetical protein
VLPKMFADIKDLLADIIAGGAPHVAVETSAPKIGAVTPPRLLLGLLLPAGCGRVRDRGGVYVHRRHRAAHG